MSTESEAGKSWWLIARGLLRWAALAVEQTLARLFLVV
jgi:hypothetical protein